MIFIDTHVHIYDCYDLDVLADAALDHFKAAARQFKIKKTSDADFVLLLSEAREINWFERLKFYADKTKNSWLSRWKIRKTPESEAICLINSDGDLFFITAGRQIITHERLEVLALLTDSQFKDGQPAKTLIQKIANRGGIPVIPWSFGKWMGQRGTCVRGLLKDASGDFLLGDIFGRPKFLPFPQEFCIAAKKNIPIIAGSDPLPLKSENWQPGSFGTAVFQKLDLSAPVSHLKYILKYLPQNLLTYGRQISFMKFAQNQINLRINRHDEKRYKSTWQPKI